MSNLRVALLVPPAPAIPSADRDDTFTQAREISECLTILGNQTLTIIFADDRDIAATDLRHAHVDLVVNLVEDLPEGADQTHVVTALLDGLDLPYAGARTAALRSLGDKREMKRQLAAAGLPVPPSPEAESTARYIVKSATEHASIGLDATSVVAGAEAAAQLLTQRIAAGGEWLAEAFIDGREFNVGILDTASGPLVLPIAEIEFLDHADRPRIVGYAEKWAEDSAAYRSTPRRFSMAPEDARLRTELAHLARRAWDAFALSGYARVDFRVDERGNPYILEINANPCLARDAGFCAAAAEIGLSQTDIVAHLIETALA